MPQTDGSRCQICRRKVFLDSHNKFECNGLCISGVKAKTILALRGQGKTVSLGRTGGQHVTTYTAMSEHAREWHRRIGGGVDVQTFATFWASLPAEHRAVTAPAPEGELCPHCKKPVRLMRKVVWRGDNEARSRIKKDGKNLWDKQCDGPCNDKARAIILRSWIEAGHEFVELEDTSAAAPRKPPPRRAAPKKKPAPAPAPGAAAGRGRPRRVHAARGREGGGEAGRESAAAVSAEGAARDASGAQGLVPGADAAGGARRRR